MHDFYEHSLQHEYCKKAKLTQIYDINSRSDCAQVWSRKRLAVTSHLPHKIYTRLLLSK